MAYNKHISIVMTYYNRLSQLQMTLTSFVRNAYEDFEVIIVDDHSSCEPLDTHMFNPYPFRIRLFKVPGKKWYRNPCVPFNLGIRAAESDIILLQNSECLHLDDILTDVRQHLSVGRYLVYACYSMDRETSRRVLNHELTDADIRRQIRLGKAVDRPGMAGWYNHGVYNPTGLHFTSAVTANDMRMLRGFDERFALGLCYDDDDFLSRIKRSRIEIMFRDDRVVLHQWHYTQPPTIDQDKFVTRNRLLFKYITGREKNAAPKIHSCSYRFFTLFYPLVWLFYDRLYRKVRARTCGSS